jgi:hypothetical protein
VLSSTNPTIEKDTWTVRSGDSKVAPYAWIW